MNHEEAARGDVTEAEALRARPGATLNPPRGRDRDVLRALGADFGFFPDGPGRRWFDVAPDGLVTLLGRIPANGGWQIGSAASRRLRVTDPDEAWEALAAAGLIPGSWHGDPGRVFLRCYPCGPCAKERSRRRCANCSGRGYVLGSPSPRPASIADVVSFASDVPGIERTEEHARELAARLAPSGFPGGVRVAWWSGPATRWRPASWPDDPARATGALGEARRAALGGPLGGWGPRRAYAADEIRTIEGIFGVRRVARWRRYREDVRALGAADGPLGPLLDIWGEGNALDDACASAPLVVPLEVPEGAVLLFRPLPGSCYGR